MICRKCQFENPCGMNFCGRCGSSLEAVCSKCNAFNPPDAEFCGLCGLILTSPAETARLKDLAFDAKLAKIQKYLPGGLTEKILSQKDRIEGEWRHVTIMFVDMKGFTTLTEKLGPEETFTLMDQVFEILIRKIYDYEGTVTELRGDGVLAFFGAPIAVEDAPQRAIRSSLAIHRELTRFNDKLKSDSKIPPVLVRIGINSGPVVVGAVGNDLRVQFTAVGDTINMAARMETMAEPGTTYVTEDTFKLVEGLFRFEALGKKRIKGKEQPLKVYRVIAPNTRRTRFDVSAERGLTRFVGRERELEVLIDAFERTKAGRGQAVSIMGEAGVGKSRLLYEFRKAVANETVTFLEGKCLSYGRGVAYHPIIDVLKSNFGIEEGESDSNIVKKVVKGLTVLKVDEASTLPYLLELLSAKKGGLDKLTMSPDAKRDRIIGALQRIVLKGSEIQPLIIAIEDLHWIDKSSEESAKHLLEITQDARALMIFTYRPEFVHTWSGKSFHSQVTLNRLSNRESLAMVSHMLGSDDIALDLQELILEKTEGIPFFTEEFVRSLRDMGIIERTNHTYRLTKELDHVTIPATIQDVIMARVDSLPLAAKEVLQAGSAIEREFSYELIRAVTGSLEQDLLSHLSVLKNAELLYERGIFPQSTYVFRHSVTREVVYDSILKTKKKGLHQKIGETIEELYKYSVGDHYGVLVEHFLACDAHEKGAHYARLASKQAEKTASLNDAILYAQKGIACLERIPVNDEVLKKIIDARTMLGLYLLQMGDFQKARDAVDPVLRVAAEKGYKRRLSQIYTVIGAFEYWAEENFSGAFDHLNRALILSKELGDMASVALASYYLAVALGLDCQFQDAYSHFEQSLKINTAVNNTWGVSTMMSSLSFFQSYHGQVELGYRTGNEALRLAEFSGDVYSKTVAYTCHGSSCYARGVLDEAIENLSKGIALGERIIHTNAVATARLALAETYFEIGNYEAAKKHCQKCMELHHLTPLLPSWANVTRMAMKKAQALSGERNTDLGWLYRCVHDNKVKIYDGWTRRYLGEILLLIDDQHIAEAQHWIEQAIEADNLNKMMFCLGRDYAIYSQLYARKGDKEAAREQLAKAIMTYKACGADGWVTKAEELLAKVS